MKEHVWNIVCLLKYKKWKLSEREKYIRESIIVTKLYKLLYYTNTA